MDWNWWCGRKAGDRVSGCCLHFVLDGVKGCLITERERENEASLGRLMKRGRMKKCWNLWTGSVSGCRESTKHTDLMVISQHKTHHWPGDSPDVHSVYDQVFSTNSVWLP